MVSHTRRAKSSFSRLLLKTKTRQTRKTRKTRQPRKSPFNDDPNAQHSTQNPTALNIKHNTNLTPNSDEPRTNTPKPVPGAQVRDLHQAPTPRPPQRHLNLRIGLQAEQAKGGLNPKFGAKPSGVNWPTKQPKPKTQTTKKEGMGGGGSWLHEAGSGSSAAWLPSPLNLKPEPEPEPDPEPDPLSFELGLKETSPPTGSTQNRGIIGWPH